MNLDVKAHIWFDLKASVNRPSFYVFHIYVIYQDQWRSKSKIFEDILKVFGSETLEENTKVDFKYLEGP